MSSFETLKSYLPPFLLEDKIFSNTLQSIGENDFDRYDESVEDLLLQVFPQTATWGLKYWEEFCGISTNESLDINTRRSKVLSKLSQVSPITRLKVENIVKNFVKDSYVENIPKEYAFRVNLNGEFNFSLQELRDVIEDIKPAHLAYFIRYFINYFYKYKFSSSALIEAKIKFYTNAFNIPTHLLLNGQATLDGKFYLNGTTRPDGIKKTIYFITQKVFSHLVTNAVNTNITSFVKGTINNNIVNSCDGGSYRFKSLNSKYTLNGELDLSNRTELIRSI
ncbi:hypothetical protein Ccar_16475 [Clostridium carboxidivorans P7]|uniref:YmfQ family protein n=1 Tax=Clostridium carboxidivorans TaxID=217159 RepID=UPI00064F2BCD|nr:YmfQ family protein [Clostridium carboxidivorans]AKN32371.1 hypothetical protein Ccar_16475 [Clostridium carboxidivorans P7]